MIEMVFADACPGPHGDGKFAEQYLSNFGTGNCFAKVDIKLLTPGSIETQRPADVLNS